MIDCFESAVVSPSFASKLTVDIMPVLGRSKPIRSFGQSSLRDDYVSPPIRGYSPMFKYRDAVSTFRGQRQARRDFRFVVEGTERAYYDNCLTGKRAPSFISS